MLMSMPECGHSIHFFGKIAVFLNPGLAGKSGAVPFKRYIYHLTFKK